MVRTASAAWNGSLKEGKGLISSESGVLSGANYSFGTRFENGIGTNPEELIAAAHAGCFSMAFSAELGKAGITPDSVSTRAEVTLEMLEKGPTVTKSHLTTTVVVDADKEVIEKAAQDAKAGCPISRLLNAEVSLDLTIS